MIKKILSTTLTAAAIATLGSCNSDSDTPGGATLYTDIVTYQGNGTGGSTFTFRKEGDSPLITLTCSRTLASDFVPGSRILIQYAPETGKQYMSGPINLAGAANVEGGGAPVEELTAAQTTNWLSDAVNVSTIFRSGEYLNLQFTGTLGSEVAKVRMVADTETLDSEYPELHLIFGPYTAALGQYYLFTCSWSIESVWNRPGCKGIKVLYKNNGGLIGGSVTINKEIQGPVKPGEEQTI